MKKILTVTDPDGDTLTAETNLFTPEGRVSLRISASGFTDLEVYVTPAEIRALADAAEEALA